MAVITPSTDLYLLKVPLEINDINQLDFANATAQFNYFNSLPKMVVDDFTYQRKDSTIRFPAQYDEVITYNYVMYRNDAYSDKWFYAFITNMEYVNDNMTLITIKSDVWQCWQFDLTYKPCLIDREHVNDDTVGKHTLPEGLELGEFVVNGNTLNFLEDVSDFCVVAEVSQIDNDGESGTLSHTWEDGQGYEYNPTPTLNGVIRGTTPLILSYNSTTAPSFSDLRKLYDDAGLSESIINVYLLPLDIVRFHGNLEGKYLTLTYTKGVNSYSVEHIFVPNSSSGVTQLKTISLQKPTSLAGSTTGTGYVPRNAKLLTYPYCYFNISNNAGTSFPFHYEDFDSTDVVFKTEGTFGVSGNFKAIPQNYKRLGTSNNAMDYSVTGAKMPVGSWKSDSYTNWLTQNAVNMETQWRSTLISAGVDTVGGFMVGQPVLGAVAGGKELISTAREQHLAKTQANFTPDQVHGNTNVGDFTWAKYRSRFTYIPMSIKKEYSEAIDSFFDQFGYKCNLVKIPNITGRRNWNYVKTVGCYIEADIPQEDLAEIKGMFDRGITIWHNPIQFGNYGANNDII